MDCLFGEQKGDAYDVLFESAFFICIQFMLSYNRWKLDKRGMKRATAQDNTLVEDFFSKRSGRAERDARIN
jgi:hypothetical protein